MMIAVAVVGLLTALAYPAYTGHLQQSRRAEAQQVLMDIASRQQQRLLDSRSYASSLPETGAVIPQSVAAVYSFTVAPSSGSAPGFVASAIPQGPQASDRCGTLAINQANIRQPAQCW
jgi:type IV pilus assembly protein PilE